MRAVGGIRSSTPISSTPISLSKAAEVLSRFAASETGATPDVDAYLRRSTTAFKELVAVHRQIGAHHKGKERLASAAVESNGVAEVKKEKEKEKYVEKSGFGTFIESNDVVEKKMKEKKAKKKAANEKRKVEMKIHEVEDNGKRSEKRRDRKENKRTEDRLH